VTASLLLDTQLLLWLRLSPEALTDAERGAIDASAMRLVSAASLWEISILLGLGKIRAPSEETSAALLSIPAGFELLAITPEHCRSYRCLPLRHRDPFDRMLIAQARVEEATLIARDRAMRRYVEDGLSLL
jgi:PIN domain nuclease of toxin-antitoxin system